MDRLGPRSLLKRIVLFVVAFTAGLLLQMGISYYQNRFLQKPQEQRTENIRSISQFLNDAEGCIQALDNYRWDYGDTQSLIQSIQDYESQSQAHLRYIHAELDQVSQEHYLLANAAITTYGTYRETVGKIVELLEVGDSEGASSLYYTRAEPCGGYMRSYIQQLLECAIQDSQSAYTRQIQQRQRLRVVQTVVIIACFSLGSAVVTSLYTLLKRVREMALASQEISRGNLDVADVDERAQDEIGQMACAFNEMKRSMKRQVQTLEEKNRMERELYRRENEALELQNLMEREKLQQLRSQINPHFLLNTMNVIQYTARQEQAERTQALLLSLGRLLRYALGSNENQTPLSREVNIVNQMYTLYRARFAERVNLVWTVSPEVELTQVQVPSFILQPLVENAFRHGLAPKESGGTAQVWIWTESESLLIRVTDDGVGMSPETLEKLRTGLLDPPAAGEHIGVYNVAARLRLLSPDGAYGLSFDSREGQGTTALLRLPLIVKEEADDQDSDCG